MSDPITTADLLRPVFDDLAGVVGEIDDPALAGPTPCTELTVDALRAHVLTWLGGFSAGFASDDGRVPTEPPPPFSSAADAADRIRDAATRLDTAVRDGAAERPLWIGESSMPGDTALGMILWEYVVHGWDLAAATGQEWTPSPGACAAAHEVAAVMLTPDYQGEGKTFGPPVPVPDNASNLDRLLGASGRDPQWTPAGS